MRSKEKILENKNPNWGNLPLLEVLIDIRDILAKKFKEPFKEPTDIHFADRPCSSDCFLHAGSHLTHCPNYKK